MRPPATSPEANAAGDPCAHSCVTRAHRLLNYVAEVHGAVLGPQLPFLVSMLLRQLREPEPAVCEEIARVMGGLAR